MPTKDLSPLTKLQSLEELKCNNIPTATCTSLLPLARCTKLRTVECFSQAKDLAALKSMRQDLMMKEENPADYYNGYMDYYIDDEYM